MIYFTSDLHLGHRGIIEMQNRPFKNVEEMNRVIVDNYNEVVHKNDTVYFLGDISHHMPIDRVNEFRPIIKLNDDVLYTSYALLDRAINLWYAMFGKRANR